MAAWIPQSFEDVCKRNAGRRKLHRRKRNARADRMMRILGAMDSARALELRKAPYGLLPAASLAMEVSKPTASRDFALVRRIHDQFGRMFGRNFDPKRDSVVWSWNWDHYGFITPESKAEGYPKPVGHFPFDTRRQETEESYCGFNQSSWHHTTFISQMSTRELIRAYSRLTRMRERRYKKFIDDFVKATSNSTS
ncbi:MAG TPA: hypothetical protein VGJ37_19090 [Pyrinomonadaceae bacterium]|jgi:hypothetical protein